MGAGLRRVIAFLMAVAGQIGITMLSRAIAKHFGARHTDAEPTESETLVELDRFIDAMIAIREGIRKIEATEWPHDCNKSVANLFRHIYAYHFQRTSHC